MPERPDLPHPDLDADLDLALRLADEADRIAMGFFSGAGVVVEIKDDGSPVTAADKAVEARIQELLAAERPGDALLGEETGSIDGSPSPAADRAAGDRRWIVDGIDGTALFITDTPGWLTLIALEVGGRIDVGVATCPSLGRRWWARSGGGAWTTRTIDGIVGAPEPTRVSDRTDPAGATYTSAPPRSMLDDTRRAVVDPVGSAFTYAPSTFQGALMVAEGLVDVCVQPTGGPWDFAPLVVIVEESGGTSSHADGTADIHRNGPVIYTNGALHALARSALTATS